MAEMKTSPGEANGTWEETPWHKLECHLYRLQKRIYRASQNGETRTVRQLQKLLMKSQAARTIAVRRVTQDNQGKMTAGVDGVKSVKPKERLAMVERIHPKHARKVKPVRRMYIPKANGKQRPLGIPTMENRAEQTLARLALEPEWEAKFEPNSYGFRPGRSCHDAIEAIFKTIRFKTKYVLDADIKGCFDNINHDALLKKLNTYSALRRTIRSWLKAGVKVEFGEWQPTETGTPQGGAISPLLANIALHGLEELLTDRFATKRKRDRSRNPGLRIIRYADDFVILGTGLEEVQEAKEITEEWLGRMGLELSPDKTRITHTLVPYQGNVGFDFLGFTVRQFRVGKHRTGKNPHGQSLGFKTIIQPSQEAIQRHNGELKDATAKMRMAKQEEVIVKLNPIIRGWANYYKTSIAKSIYNKCDHILWKILWRWATRRHPNKNRQWRAQKYWKRNSNGTWNFCADDKELYQHSKIAIQRHVKVRGEASPYDGNLAYWGQRLKNHPMLRTKTGKLLKQQGGKCRWCSLQFRDGDQMEIDHIVPKAIGGKDEYSNLQLLHRHCHDQRHTELASVTKTG